MKIEKNTLVELYQVISKHSNYQILPNLLKGILDQKDLTVKSRFESERFEFMNAFVDFKDKHVLDIGGNTGYFGFSTLEQGAKSVKIIEGNKAHAEFVEAASNYLEVNLSVENRYLEFNLQDNFSEKFDVVFLLNVIHHLGDDYGDKNLAMSEAKKIMKKSIQYFNDKTEKLIFQMGYCWKGDRNLLLFENGTKEEMIAFVEEAIDGYWKIEAVGIAQEAEGTTKYELLNTHNIKRNDTLGEFRNRPIFILSRKVG